MFGSDGNIEHPEDIRTSITHREEKFHTDSKYIFKPYIIKNSSSIWIHHLINVKLNKTRIRIANNLIRLNHYPIQSIEFFTKVKMTRGDVVNHLVENVRDMNYFNAYNINANFCDETLKKLILNTPLEY